MVLNDILSTLNISVLNVGFKESGSEWKHRAVISPYCRICMVLEGETYFMHDGETFHLTPGTMHLVPAFRLSDYDCPEWFRYYYVNFTSRLPNGLDLFSVLKYEYTLETTDYQRALFARLVELLPDRDVVTCQPHTAEDKKTFLKDLENSTFNCSPATFIESDGIVRSLMAPFIDSADLTTVKVPSENFSAVIQYIEENISRDLSLEKLAGIVNLNSSYFSNQFVNLFGIRPVEYVIRRRIEHAQSLIIGQAYSMNEIAEKTGFSDLSHFSRTFKKFTGAAPSKYFSGK